MSMSEKEIRERDYWNEFRGVLAKTAGPLSADDRSPLEPKSWMSFPVGKSGVELNAVVEISNARIRAEIRFCDERARRFFQMFWEERIAIERELGFPLDWWKEPKKKDAKNYRIAIHDYTDSEDRRDWPRQHEWLIERLCKMHPVVKKYVTKFGG